MFKKIKVKNVRKRRHSSDSDENSDENDKVISKLEDIRELQKLREKPKGVSSVGLALGKKIPVTVEIDSHDPFKMKTGGYVDMKALKTQGTVLTEEEKDAIGTAFAAETNRRDEDAEMLKYVEDELKRRRGIETESEKQQQQQGGDPKANLFKLPEKLEAVSSKAKKSEDMLSNQMLSGIPEVDLGIDAKIKNIEETEDAKQKLIEERMRKQEQISVFVPTNMAVNFVQHNRFNIEDNAPVLKKGPEAPAKAAPRVGDADKGKNPLRVQPDGKEKTEKATDNYHFNKFRQQMRR